MTKIKIKSRNPIDAPKPANGGKASPVPQGQMPERKKESFISVCVGIIKDDIRKKIHGDEEGVKMPESTESWKDWEDQI